MTNRAFFYKSILNSLRVSFSRVSVIATSLFIGACVSSAFLNISFDIESKLSNELKVYGANFVISPAHGQNHIDSRLYDEKIAQIPKDALKASAPFLYGTFSLGSNSAIVAGVDFGALKSVFPFIEVRDGHFGNSVFSSESAFVGESLAKNLELKAGNKITITNPKNLNSVDLEIKGIISSGDEFDGILFAPLRVVQDLVSESNAESRAIHYAKLVLYGNFAEVAQIGESLSDDFITAKPIAQVSISEGIVLNKIKSLMLLICLIILLIASLSVNTSLSSIIFARKKEVALHLSLGAKKSQIAKLFGTEVLLLALIASVIGALCGYLLANLLGFIIFNSSISFRIFSVFGAVAITLFFAFVASFYPIKKALNINIITNLKGE